MKGEPIKTVFDDPVFCINSMLSIATVTKTLLTGVRKKKDFYRYTWFYDNIMDVLTRHVEAKTRLKRIHEAYLEAKNCGYTGDFVDYVKSVGAVFDKVNWKSSYKTLPKKEDSV